MCIEIEIKSDATLAEAVKILARHNILSAPVVDVEAPEDASWLDRYIGIIEFAGIVVWILHQVRHTSIHLYLDCDQNIYMNNYVVLHIWLSVLIWGKDGRGHVFTTDFFIFNLISLKTCLIWI